MKHRLLNRTFDRLTVIVVCRFFSISITERSDVEKLAKTAHSR